jgi:lipopolysaccharide/colanic/teichoic acid biosynthesis glycosyltransferase
MNRACDDLPCAQFPSNASESTKTPRRSLRAKRLLDVIASFVGLVLLLPLLAVVALLVAIIDGRPVLFLQERIGLNGKPFTLCKFRSMRNSTKKGLEITFSPSSN